MITVLGSDSKFLLQCDYKVELDRLYNLIGALLPEAKFFEGTSGFDKPSMLIERSFGIPEKLNSLDAMTRLLVPN